MLRPTELASADIAAESRASPQAPTVRRVRRSERTRTPPKSARSPVPAATVHPVARSQRQKLITSEVVKTESISSNSISAVVPVGSSVTGSSTSTLRSAGTLS